MNLLFPTGFPLSFDTEIQGLSKDFQGPSNFIFEDQFSRMRSQNYPAGWLSSTCDSADSGRKHPQWR